MLVCLLPGSGLSTSPFCGSTLGGSTQYARPEPAPAIATEQSAPTQPPKHLLHCSLVGMLCCCGSAQLMRHLPLARDHVLSPQPNKSEGVSPGYWGDPKKGFYGRKLRCVAANKAWSRWKCELFILLTNSRWIIFRFSQIFF